VVAAASVAVAVADTAGIAVVAAAAIVVTDPLTDPI
jgi:hypothetical protein